MLRSLQIVALCWLCATSGIGRGAKPNLSGTWVLDVGKSDFAGTPAPKSIVQEIVHTEPELSVRSRIDYPSGSSTSQQTFKIDGTTTTGTMVVDGVSRTATSSGKWEGETLNTWTSFEVEGTKIDVNESWSLSAARNSLTIIRAVKMPQGSVVMTTVYVKQ